MEANSARTLVLLRHAKSAWPGNVPDHDRPLAGRGRRAAPAAGRWLRREGYIPDHVLCSTARRARETWQLVQPELGVEPPAAFDRRVYKASERRLLELVRGRPAAARTVMVIGHDPALPELALALAGQDYAHGGQPAPRTPDTALGRMAAKFPTAAVAVLEFRLPWSELEHGRALLASFVTPRDMDDSPDGAQG